MPTVALKVATPVLVVAPVVAFPATMPPDQLVVSDQLPVVPPVVFAWAAKWCWLTA